jgi:LmbE family N-acetylglucosaminyl deacetylase
VIAVISPHLDDAAFSLTEHILTWVAEGEQVKIVTVFGGIPADEKGLLKHTRMHAEHIRACEALGVQRIHANFFDDVYKPRPSRLDVWPVIAAMIGNASIIVVPTGIHHPDHHLVERACYHNLGFKGYWHYDELPYYVQHPHQCSVSESDWDHHDPTDHFERVKHAEGLMEEKWRIVNMYESQIGELERRTLLAPERCWRPL